MEPFSLRERTCKTYPWMEFNLHGHNRTDFEAGIVGTAINGTIRLQSDFEVRYSSLFNSYIHHSIFGSCPAIRVQHASGNPSQVSRHSFLYIGDCLIG
jgi:hypothetical protein